MQYSDPPGAYDGGYTQPTLPQSTRPSSSPGTINNSPIPDVDPMLLAQANDAYARAQAAIQSRRRNTLTSYGFMANGYDDSGNPTGLAVDPKSMYGKYQQMLDSQAHNSMDAENAGLSAGFVGGLANQGESALRYQQGGERLNLSNAMLGEFSSEEQDLLNAQAVRDQAILNAYLSGARSGDYTPAPEGSNAAAPLTGSRIQALGSPFGGWASNNSQSRAKALAKKTVSGYSQKSKAHLH